MNDADRETPDPLAEFYVPWVDITSAEIASFNEALTGARDEPAMQAFLQENPRFLLQHLTARRGYWVIPRKRLGAEYETDFLLAEDDANRLTWHAVELERPQARLFTIKGDPTAALIHALRQINDWRNWLSHNRDYATRSRDHSGLGLKDIDPELEGLIIMGREAHTNASTVELRRRLMRDNRVRIYTYDWLARQAFERHATVTQRDTWLDQLFTQERERDSPKKAVEDVFGGVGWASTSISATRTLEWDFVSIQIDGEEVEVVFDEVRAYRDPGSKALTLHDWQDWLESAFDNSGLDFRFLASELPPNERLQQSLKLHSDGVWFEIRQRHIAVPTEINVLVYLPRTLATEEKRGRARQAQRIFEENGPKVQRRYLPMPPKEDPS